MAISKFSTLLSTRLAGRVFLFVACLILVPALVTGGIAFFTMEQQVKTIKGEQLRTSAKSLALDSIRRLKGMSSLLLENAREIESGQRALPVQFESSATGFLSLELMSLSEVDNLNLIWPEQMVEADRDIRSVDEADVVLAMRPVNEHSGAAFMLIYLSGAKKALVGSIDSEYLWGTKDLFSYQTWFCVVADSQVTLFCPTDIGRNIQTALKGEAYRSRSGSLELIGSSGAYLGEYWSLNNHVPGLLIPRLQVGVVQPEAYIREGIAIYSYRLFPLAGIAILAAAWISMVVIRRQLKPLKTLTTAAARIAAGNFSDTLKIQTADEFSELGSAFNLMRLNLSKQFRQLSALSKLDRMILAHAGLDKVIEIALQGLQSLLEQQKCWLTTVDSEAKGEGASYWISAGKTAVENHSLDASLLAEVRSEDTLFTISSITESALIPYPEVSDAICFPIFSAGKVYGYIGVESCGSAGLDITDEGVIQDFVGRIAVAISSAKHDERLFLQGNYDVLTGLPNRNYFRTVLEQRLSEARQTSSEGTVLFIDIDGFKLVNDSEGHSTGDFVLQIAAKRLAACLKDSDFLARLGGDEFIIVLDGISNESEIRMICNRVIELLQQPFEVESRKYHLGGSIGIAVYPSHGHSVESLLRNADSAMYVAKSKGGSCAEFYREKIGQAIRQRAQAEQDLRNAFESGQLCMYYQPQFDLRSGKIVGAEALMRWLDPVKGARPTQEFIPLAEESGLIVELGKWSLRQACADCLWLSDRGISLSSLSVNISGREFNDAGFGVSAPAILNEYQIKKGAIQLEITESVLIEFGKRSTSLFAALREAGFKISIDDFGTGYSSLSYLRRFPFDALKIDREFVKDLPADPQACAIAEAIVQMADGLGKTIVAEGVENDEQLEYLRSLHCNVIQGFIFSPAVSLESLYELAKKSGTFADIFQSASADSAPDDESLSLECGLAE